MSAIDLALLTIKEKKQTIIFVNTKRGAEKTAEDIAKESNLSTNLEDDILQVLSKPTKQCKRLAKCVKKGIAFHHSGLAAKQRDIIETEFRTGNIKVIAATPTLAIGIDMPAFRVIMRDLKRFGPRGMQPIPVLEYMQMTGRAGRPKYDTHGEAITIAGTENEKEEIIKTYINGEPEDIYSKLAVEPVLRTYVLSLISSKYLNSREQIIKFFSKTFWAHQFGDMNKLVRILDKMLALLEKWEFISSDNTEGFIDAENYGDINYTTTPTGKRVAELYLDPLTANHIIEFFKPQPEDFELLQMITYTLEMRPLLKAGTKDLEKINEKLLQIQLQEPSMFDFEYQEFMNSVKTAMCIDEWINEADEEYLMSSYNIRPGEIKIKLDIADWLCYATEELARIKKETHLLSQIRKLRTRIKYGVREELLPLLKLKNIGRVRARKLYNHNIKDTKSLKNIDITSLNQILGKKRAADVKNQVGEKVPIVKENKRKGQISLTDF